MTMKEIGLSEFLHIVTETLGNTAADIAHVVNVLSIVIHALDSERISFKHDSRGMREQIEAGEILSKIHLLTTK